MFVRWGYPDRARYRCGPPRWRHLIYKEVSVDPPKLEAIPATFAHTLRDNGASL